MSNAICSVEECSRRAVARGWCDPHYRKLRDPNPCTISGCDKPQKARGLCIMHSKRLSKHGNTDAHWRSPSLSPADLLAARAEWVGDCLIWTGSTDTTGYGQIKVDGKTVQVHRLAYEIEHGPIPHDATLDHTCWNRACIRPVHLRLATAMQNAQNRNGAYENNKLGVRNIRQRPSGKYEARVTVSKKRTYLGSFDSIEDAVAVVESFRAEHFKEYAGRSRRSVSHPKEIR